MGDGADVPGLADLIAGRSSFAQTIFRDRKSRVHFVPAGGALDAATGADERLETILSALTLTYDYVLIDCPDALIPAIGPGAGAAVVVSEFDADDARSETACERVEAACDGRIHLLVVDPAGGREAAPANDMTPQRASA
jgi:MinD-like ATPase involved in chromosome partitioning or flagellar assembly